MLALVVVGAASLLGLGVDRFPNIDFPVVIVTTVVPGSSPEQVESEVTDKVEEAVNTISGIDSLRSNSFEGLSVVMVQFSLDKDASVGAQEVRDRVNRILSQLPSTIQQPRVERVDPDATPVMLVALSGTRSTRELTEFASRRVRRRIESLSGVGGVVVLGGRARQINIDVDPQRLQSFGLTVTDVQRALQTQNVEVPGGEVRQGVRSYQLRVRGRVQTVEELNEIAVSTRGGLTVRVRDVATVVDGEAQASSVAQLNGRDVVVLSITKQSGTNTVAVIDALRERVSEVQRELPPGFELRIVRDESEFIRNAIHAVEEHLILGSLFAALIVLVFLWNGRSTLIAALAIPTSIISTFVLIRAMRLTLNTITLLGLTLAVGIVIDDAIVVLENIVKFVEDKGLNPRRAAVLATREIGLAVLATTLSLVAVFLPVAFMGGIVGRFMASFGFTMSFSILVSLLVSFTLTPMLSSRWLKPSARARHVEVDTSHLEKEEEADAEWVEPVPEPRGQEVDEYLQWSQRRRSVPEEYAHSEHGSGGLYGLVEGGYTRLLAFVMRHRWLVGLLIIAAFGSCGPLFRRVQKNFLPVDDESRFDVQIRAPEGTSLNQTRLISERLARATRELPGVAYTVLTVGSAPGDSSGRGSNQASLFVALTAPTTRALDQQGIMSEVRRRVLPLFASEHLRVAVAPVNAFGGGGAADSASIQYVVRGAEIDQLTRYSQSLLEAARRIPGTVDHDSTLVVGRPEYSLLIDRARAADLGISVADISNAVRLLVGDVQVSSYNEGGEQYEVHVLARSEVRSDPTRLSQALVASPVGRQVRLSDIARIRETTGPAVVQHLSRQRQVTVYMNTVPGTSEQAVIEAMNAASRELHMAPGYSTELAGRSRELGRAGQSFLIAFGLSLAFMYLILAAQFESWIHPITILLSLPLTVPFAVLSLVLLNQSINIFSALGILVLFGIVKKNSILQVDHMRDLRRRGLSRADAVMIGNRDRLRPILMTTAAFVAGMIPLAVSSGAGSGTNRAMSTVIIGGQTLSLLLTLLATPVVYTWFDDLANSTRLKFLWRIVTAPLRLLTSVFESREPPRDPPHATHP